MMDKLNIVQKTVMALILATMVLLVAVPLLAFTTVAFSNSVEMTEFPKRLIPKRTVTVRVAPTPEGEFEIFYDSGEGYESIITTKRASKLEAHFTRQYAVTVPGEELAEDFKQTLTNGPMEFTYKKDLFYNFKTFFSIADGMDYQQYLYRNQQRTGRSLHDIWSEQCTDLCEDHSSAGLSGFGGKLDVFIFNSLE